MTERNCFPARPDFRFIVGSLHRQGFWRRHETLPLRAQIGIPVSVKEWVSNAFEIMPAPGRV